MAANGSISFIFMTSTPSSAYNLHLLNSTNPQIQNTDLGYQKERKVGRDQSGVWD